MKTYGGYLEQLGTNWCLNQKVLLPKIGRSLLKYGFLLPKDMVPELINRPGVAGAVL